MKKLKWQKPILRSIGNAFSSGCIDCNGGYSAFDNACSKGFQASIACSQGAGINGHKEG